MKTEHTADGIVSPSMIVGGRQRLWLLLAGGSLLLPIMFWAVFGAVFVFSTKGSAHRQPALGYSIPADELAAAEAP